MKNIKRNWTGKEGKMIEVEGKKVSIFNYQTLGETYANEDKSEIITDNHFKKNISNALKVNRNLLTEN